MVFTGLVQAHGRAIFNSATNELHVRAPADFWTTCKAGDSIAVNGCCLTLLEATTQRDARFFVMEESRDKVNLLQLPTVSTDEQVQVQFALSETDSVLTARQSVNLELAMREGDRYGGHMMSGHVDGTARIVRISALQDGSHDVWIDLSSLNPTLDLVTRKGSICLDGTSLTVATVDYATKCVRVSVIPHTWEHTRISIVRVGDWINVEFDQALKKLRDNAITATASANASTHLWNTVPVIHLPEEQRTQIDRTLMLRAIKLGEQGRATSAPNPWVGCVVTDVCGNVLGEGYHRKAGQAHAEVNAINDAHEAHQDVTGGTCYTTLEPCNHTGRTGPCTQWLLKHGIARVVVAICDPDDKVQGAGVRVLREAGVRVDVDVCAVEATLSLRSYLYHRRTGLPWVVLKIGSSLDANLAAVDGTSQWITGAAAREDVHRTVRAYSQAIVTGQATALMDNPSFTTRHLAPTVFDYKQPTRVVLASASNPIEAHQLGEHLRDMSLAPTWLVYGKKIPVQEPSILHESVFVRIIAFTELDAQGHVEWKELLRKLAVDVGAVQVLIEGGAHFNTAALDAGIVNQLIVYQSPLLLGANGVKWYQNANSVHSLQDAVAEFKLEAVKVLDNDVRLDYIANSI